MLCATAALSRLALTRLLQVAPLLIVGETTLIGISTLLSSTNFYTRLLRLRDKVTNAPIFTVLSVELACAKCKEDGKAAECVHMLHLIPRYLPFPCRKACGIENIFLSYHSDGGWISQVAVGNTSCEIAGCYAGQARSYSERARWSVF